MSHSFCICPVSVGHIHLSDFLYNIFFIVCIFFLQTKTIIVPQVKCEYYVCFVWREKHNVEEKNIVLLYILYIF